MLFRNEESENYLLKVYVREKNILLDGLIPFAITEHDDFICFYFNRGRKQEPTVYILVMILHMKIEKRLYFQLLIILKGFLNC